MTGLVVAPHARRDIARRVDYLLERNPDAPAAFVAGLGALFAMLVDGNVDGAETTLRHGRRIRRWPVPPMVVFYDRHATLVRIVRVYHGRRRPIAR